MTYAYPKICNCVFISESRELLVRCDTHNSVQDIIDDSLTLASGLDLTIQSDLDIYHLRIQTAKKNSTISTTEADKKIYVKLVSDNLQTNHTALTRQQVDNNFKKLTIPKKSFISKIREILHV